MLDAECFCGAENENPSKIAKDVKRCKTFILSNLRNINEESVENTKNLVLIWNLAFPKVTAKPVLKSSFFAEPKRTFRHLAATFIYVVKSTKLLRFLLNLIFAVLTAMD